MIVNNNYNYGGVWRENISKCFKLQVTKTREKKKEAHFGLSMRMYLWVYNLEPKLRNRKILPGPLQKRAHSKTSIVKMQISEK